MVSSWHLATTETSSGSSRRQIRAANFRRWFKAAPHAYLLLNRSLEIIAVNPLYARITMSGPDAILGRAMFDAFPDNPGDPCASGVANLARSLRRVMTDRRADVMHWQRYDIRDWAGDFVERHWSPVNAPVMDDNGEVEFIIHSVEDVTATVKRLDTLLPPQRR